MLISDEKSFLFVHVPKAAGTSIRWVLRSYAYKPDRGIRNRLMSRLHIRRDYRKYAFRRHAPFTLAERVVPAGLLADLYKIGFVRNPWDRLVSLYAYILGRPDHPLHQRVHDLGDFGEFVEFQIRRNAPTQRSLLVDRRGRIAMDFVGRFENLETDLGHVCRQLDIPPELPERQGSIHEPYETYYSPSLIERVGRYWQEDVAEFGYAFGAAAEEAGSDT